MHPERIALRPTRHVPGGPAQAEAAPGPGTPSYLVRGNPRSTLEVPGSGQRAVTTFARV